MRALGRHLRIWLAIPSERASPRLLLSGVLPDQRDTGCAVTPSSISLGLVRSLLRRHLSAVGRSGTPWIRRNSATGRTCSTRPSASRIVTGAASSSSSLIGFWPAAVIDFLRSGTPAALDASVSDLGSATPSAAAVREAAPLPARDFRKNPTPRASASASHGLSVWASACRKE